LVRQIVRAVELGEYLVSVHAQERLEERQIELWQIEVGLSDGTVVTQQLDAEPNPVIRVRFELPDGSLAEAVWGWLETSQQALLVTTFFPEE
jgi:hypothetical protein